MVRNQNKKQKSSSSLQVENSNSMLTSLAHNQTKATFLFSSFIVPDYTLSPCPLTELIWVVQDAPDPDETLPMPLAFVI